MSTSTPLPGVDDPNLSDSDPDALFDSPDTRRAKKQAKAASNTPTTTTTTNGITTETRTSESRYDASEAREAALRTELASIRNINRVVEDMVSSLQKAKSNMSTVNNTINQSTTLLQTWTRILSQTEHNQRLILNPNWHGATQDLADMESEEAARRAAQERREAEEQARREEAARRAEEDERRRAIATPTGRGRGTGVGRGPRGRVVSGGSRTGTTSASSGYVGVGGQGGRGTSRGTSSGRASGSAIGRGVRGRGRAT